MAGIKNTAIQVGDTALTLAKLVLTLNFVKLRRLLKVNTLFDEANIVGNFSGMRELFFNAPMAVRSDTPSSLPASPRNMPAEFVFRGKTTAFADWLEQRKVTAMVVLKNGELAHEDYFRDTSPKDLRISWSMAKSFLSACFGIAVGEGLLNSLDEPVTNHVPRLKNTTYDGCPVRDVLNMASGVDFNEDYLDYNSDINRMGRALALGRSMDDFAGSLKHRARAPGTRRKYVSIDTHVVGMVLRAITGRSAADYMAEKLLTPMRLEADPYYLTDGLGVDFVLGGLNLCTRDYARFGLLFAQGGRLNNEQIVPADWVKQSTTSNGLPPAEDIAPDEAALGYGFQWWLPPQATKGEFFALGIYGQYIYVNQTLKTVVAINSADRDFKEGDGRVTLENLAMFRAIVAKMA